MEKEIVQKHVGKGIALALLASTFWGISGTVLQIISQGENIPADWYLSTRTFFAGFILLIISFAKYRMKIFDVFKSWRSVGWLLAYAIFGLMANLYTFYFAVQTGNAAAATILQYLSPLFIVLGSLIFQKQVPLRSDVVAFVIAMIGVFLAITHGNVHELSIPLNALIWGIFSGLTAAFYVVLPKPVTKDHSPVIVLGWALIIGSLFFNIRHPFWTGVPPIHVSTVLSMGTVIVVGTILPFLLLLHSLDFAPSAVVSILDAVQPVVTFILSLLFLHLEFNYVSSNGKEMVQESC
ncbi:EamA family transporter [Lentilactobacillus curieae]|uniref:EamA family transporter n=1 Tax=Lentilactobacillus curieae TaxID=1138822 RepID=A0A1S6QGH9_9LACO|nr:DMT family transporter [Lentilactobacillus curieae]AQW20726.1 EamA family transporter [Lentilactobacillus curieae]